ncbi:hypothetical protein [Pseudomonas sp. M30-35]|uniref:hypothetical protein n=1 Tax=Pseudomonas sp. M30-35 TaxID=1981174 RepID=UPI000B3C417E|nr:hypothetical protein [Pseudomonas sp. M30-35]ARU90463.1 hypothetical protein B9K09_22005 [Pseudomonas sp. M30-35]
MDDKVLVTNWSLPCPAKEASDGSFSMLTALSNAAGGTYPIGANGLWHGGIHFDKGTANSFDQSSVKCIADGEVIAYRIDASYPTTVYPGKPPMQTTAAFSTGFVLVKHTLQAPEKPTKPESGTAQTSADTATATPPPSITLFSLYMHLKDWKSYQADTKLAKPSFWGEGAEYAVKSDAKDPVLGLNARSGYTGQTGYSTIYGVIPRGVIVEASEASPDGRWLKVSSTTPNVAELTGDAWVYKEEMHSLGADRYLISEKDSKDKPATEILGLNVRATEQGGDIIAVLPRASVITVSGTGKYRKLESIVSGISTPALIPAADGKLPGYVWFESLVADAKPKNTDSIVILDTPTAIKAGELIGHIGTYQNNDAVDQQQLHVELFSCDDVPGFISRSRAWAASLADGQKTLLKIHKGASKLIAHHEGISETNPPKLTDAGTEVGVTLTIPQNLLDGLPATHKIKVSVPGTSGQPAEVTNWWRLENLLADKDGKSISGWLCEQELITTRHSPWEWEGYDYIEETGKPVEHVAYALDSMGMLDKQEQTNYQTMINKVDGGPLTSAARLYEIIDSNKDDKLSSREIKSALAKPWSAQALAQIITKYESEWFKNPAKWDELDDILTPEPSEPNLIWTAEKQRIEKLSWWDQLAGQQGLSADGKAWHFQVVGMIHRCTNDDNDIKWLKVPFGQLTFDVEGNDVEDVTNPLHRYFSRVVHWPGGASGITIGRGYDLGQRPNPAEDLANAGIKEPLYSWLLASKGLSGNNAKNYLSSAPDEVKKQTISRKQQYLLFIPVYEFMKSEVVRISSSPANISKYGTLTWSNLESKIQDIAVDLIYRGDYTPSSRQNIQKEIVENNLDGLRLKLSTKSLWVGVPEDRYFRRIKYLE